MKTKETLAPEAAIDAETVIETPEETPEVADASYAAYVDIIKSASGVMHQVEISGNYTIKPLSYVGEPFEVESLDEVPARLP